MGESLFAWTPSCNGAVRVELSGQRPTSDSGALLLREALDNSGVVEALEDNALFSIHAPHLPTTCETIYKIAAVSPMCVTSCEQ